MPASSSPSAFNDTFISDHKDSAPHLQAALASRQLLDPKMQSQNEKDLHATLELPTLELADVEAGLDLLTQWNSDKDVRQNYVAGARKRFAEATVLMEA